MVAPRFSLLRTRMRIVQLVAVDAAIRGGILRFRSEIRGIRERHGYAQGDWCFRREICGAAEAGLRASTE